ncbi:uncharacterized protein LOC109604325 isoform X2 [Aethina tumida]|uniref:uncharacterized protein LOC109604325 isoform X2 n=1 Tax=Aethina tumida TaxID=116153 RepID=UPI0021479C54|nr:uncharacterized protein LOC109604325 isoform X2 [Aethina tumida]
MGEARGPSLDAVRALHQTVVALRAALEQSKTEILELKSKAWPSDAIEETLRALTLENHVLRRKLLEKNSEHIQEEVVRTVQKELVIENVPQLKNEEVGQEIVTEQVKHKKVTIVSPKASPKHKHNIETKVLIRTESRSPRKNSRSLESLTILKPPTSSGKLTFSKTVSFSNISSVTRELTYFNHNNMDTDKQANNVQSPTNEDNEEVDDIELIFTTDDTKEQDFKEQLVSIDAGESNVEQAQLLQCPVSELDLDVSDRELDDDVFNDNFENENQENSNFQSFDLKRDNSQLYNSKSDNSINHEEKSLKSYYSYQDSSFENKSLEKDESFDRFEEKVRIVETDISKCGIHDVEYVGGRRNTCPNPIQYRPLLHREALARGKKARPILTHSNAARKESGAQTDISALPSSSWRSESSLANKARMGETFTTLPSKFPLPGSRLRLSEKTVEARRVLLSDIGFTSMVPELSRSADHLCPDNLKPPTTTTYGQFLRTTDLYSPGYTKFTWTAATATPSDGSQSHSRYSSMFPLSPPAPSRRCSAPVSPSRRTVLKQAPSKVRFANGSLPELRSDWTLGADSGDSTDSLVEEAENYLRRSIDCIMTGRDVPTYSENKKGVPRRASAPEPSGDNVPPQGWQPFLPRIPRDLRPDHWVKVITQEGRVRGGRVRYVGPVASQPDQFVGVQLSTPDGYCDGSHTSRRYFQCEPYHGIFVPFKKVIMGWRP